MRRPLKGIPPRPVKFLYVFQRALRYHWLKFLRLQDDPRKLAWGMVLGVFVGITPTVPFISFRC